MRDFGKEHITMTPIRLKPGHVDTQNMATVPLPQLDSPNKHLFVFKLCTKL